MANDCPPVEVLIKELGLDQATAAKVFGLMDGTIDPEEFASVKAWRAQCYHWPPRDPEVIMCAINEVIEGYGVESIEVEGYQVDSYHFGHVAAYVNMGDTYVATIVHDNERQIYRAMSYGDWLQEWETEHPVCPECGAALDADKHCKGCGWQEDEETCDYCGGSLIGKDTITTDEKLEWCGDCEQGKEK